MPVFASALPTMLESCSFILFPHFRHCLWPTDVETGWNWDDLSRFHPVSTDWTVDTISLQCETSSAQVWISASFHLGIFPLHSAVP